MSQSKRSRVEVQQFCNPLNKKNHKLCAVHDVTEINVNHARDLGINIRMDQKICAPCRDLIRKNPKNLPISHHHI